MRIKIMNCIFWGMFTISPVQAEVKNIYSYAGVDLISISSLVNDGGAICPKPIIQAYTGHLQLQSKYDQTNQSKSVLSSSISKETLEIKEVIDSYTKSLIGYSNYAVKYAEADSIRYDKINLALSCHSKALQSWAESNALLSNNTSKTGKATRKWALSAIASSSLKLMALTKGNYELNSLQKDWLSKLAEMVIADYTTRLDPDFKYFNNHDYWAGWSVASVGSIVNKDEYVEWGLQSYYRAVSQVKLIESTDYGVLPVEMARKSLAANYTHFALTPLVMLHKLALVNGYSTDISDKFNNLIRFAADTLLKKEVALSIYSDTQKAVPVYKLAWLNVYLSFGANASVTEVYAKFNNDIESASYSMIGGIVGPFFNNDKI